MNDATKSDPGSQRHNTSLPPSSWVPCPLVINAASLPDFPVLSATRQKQALAHKKLVNIKYVDVRSPDLPLEQEIASHKRLETVGDAWIRSCLYQLLFTRYPRMTVATISAVAGILLSNATFSWLAWYYGLFDPILLNEAQSCPNFVYNGQKPAADLFEAWFGAVVVECSFEAAMDWLEHIFCDAVCQDFDQWVRTHQDSEHERLRVKSENGSSSGVRKHNSLERSSFFSVEADALLAL
ncbi:hypothetical protein JCM5353_000357 [Sporobolomyces roseus]